MKELKEIKGKAFEKRVRVVCGNCKHKFIIVVHRMKDETFEKCPKCNVRNKIIDLRTWLGNINCFECAFHRCYGDYGVEACVVDGKDDFTMLRNEFGNCKFFKKNKSFIRKILSFFM